MPASNDTLTEHPVLKALQNLKSVTRISFDQSRTVEQAFLLGLWYKSFPPYMVENLDRAYDYDLEHIDPENKSNWHLDKLYPHFFKFQFVSDTGDSWHQCYRDLRSLGWQRLKVWREGGRLQYLFRNSAVGMPEGYSHITLLLDISISTCKRIKVGTQMVEQDIFETKCEDLVDLNDDEPPPAYAAAFANEPSEPRCEHGNLSGCCGQSDCPHFMGHDDPEPSTIEPRNLNEDDIPF